MVKAFICHVRGFGKDRNGMENVIWLTSSQAKKLIALRNNPESSSKFVEVGDCVFSPKDVLFIEKKNRDWYDAPRYFKERIKEEVKQLEMLERRKDGPIGIESEKGVFVEESSNSMADFRCRREDFIRGHLNDGRRKDCERIDGDSE